MKRTVLITGASRGIGRETAKIFAASGYNVVVNYLESEEQALDLIFKLQKKNHNAIAIKADVSKDIQVQAMIDEAIGKFGKIDVLVNNAGIDLYKQIQDTTYEDFCKVMKINVGGVFNCCRSVVPHMIKEKNGLIINISSIWGEQGASCEVVYSASKSAVIGFSKALKKELEPSNISVEYISPGFVKTRMTKRFIGQEISEELGEIVTPSTIAREVFSCSLKKF
ncbi:MAG: SDR family NAD(P)-dependent oxidoreductase [Oscillospiraceae bacterium]|jgi:3-oxoacyl-[acyl-carrier protein] reductase|nr:SDR family NAD(P)-dependent oxidoreductase [Oscillospiraceae bacterium]